MDVRQIILKPSYLLDNLVPSELEDFKNIFIKDIVDYSNARKKFKTYKLKDNSEVTFFSGFLYQINRFFENEDISLKDFIKCLDNEKTEIISDDVFLNQRNIKLSNNLEFVFDNDVDKLNKVIFTPS